MLAGESGFLASAASALLEWYDRERRDLPWRRRRDSYAIWVSEVMLQQTRVETVVRYYETFLERFADVSKLAAASEEEVLAAWSGLGYYRRARNLHAAARELAASDVLPRGAAEWGRLPGIGEYTAAAIASIADGQVVAVLDGNVERVVSRLLASTGDPKRAETRRQLKEAAGRLLDVRRPGDSNQALMELGATLCRPREPLCSSCPLEDVCAGRAAGDPERFPRPRRRKRAERVVRQVFVVERDGRFLLFRRSRQERLLAGLWELPWVEGSHRRSWAASLADKYGGDWGVGGGIGRVRHSITHRRFTIDAYLTTWQPDEVAEPVPAGWYHRDEIGRLPTSSLVAKVLHRRWQRPRDVAARG